jgi:uncharacterized protein (DUF1800 family)
VLAGCPQSLIAREASAGRPQPVAPRIEPFHRQDSLIAAPDHNSSPIFAGFPRIALGGIIIRAKLGCQERHMTQGDESLRQAAVALHRFGLGPRAGSIAALASDPRGAVLAEIDRPDAGQIREYMMSSTQASRAAFNFRQERQAKLIAARARAENGGMADSAMASGTQSADVRAVKLPPPAINVQQEIFFGEAKVRLDAAFKAEIGFAERLVWFWSNHFCVSADVVPNMAGGFEREAIRPHVLGKFADMLLAVETHPAMLVYLNNSRSIGPDSIAGLVTKRGLNENLAREILELHTLGVRTGYSQDDVTRFAKVITGWTILPVATNPEHGAEFVFNPRMHEPGVQKVVDKEYANGGFEQGKAVLADLARHPATARHIATKLARHFSTDDPPAALVERLEKQFLETGGDLKELAKTLIASPECWSGSLTKLKRPSEWLIASARLLGVEPPTRPSVRAQALLGEPLWRPPAPKGFSDEQGAWIDGVAERIDVANRIGQQVGADIDPHAIIDTALGPLASRETRQAVARAESRQQALALALMSPGFQRR